VTRAVELRARVVGHSAVDRDVVDAAAPLRRADSVQRHAGPADQGTSRLEDEAGGLVAALPKPRHERAGGLRHWWELGRARVPHTEAAAEVDAPRRPAALIAAARAELAAPVY